MDDITRWPERHGLEKYAAVFVDNEIDLDALTSEALKELEIPLGARMRILQAIAADRDDASDGAVTEPSPAATPPPEPGPTPGGTGERRQLTVMFTEGHEFPDLVDARALLDRRDQD